MNVLPTLSTKVCSNNLDDVGRMQICTETGTLGSIVTPADRDHVQSYQKSRQFNDNNDDNNLFFSHAKLVFTKTPPCVPVK